MSFQIRMYCELLQRMVLHKLNRNEKRGKIYYIVGFPWGLSGYKRGEIPLYSHLSMGENLLYSHFPGGKNYYIAMFPGGKMARGKGYYTTPVFVVYEQKLLASVF